MEVCAQPGPLSDPKGNELVAGELLVMPGAVKYPQGAVKPLPCARRHRELQAGLSLPFHARFPPGMLRVLLLLLHPLAPRFPSHDKQHLVRGLPGGILCCQLLRGPQGSRPGRVPVTRSLNPLAGQSLEAETALCYPTVPALQPKTAPSPFISSSY